MKDWWQAREARERRVLQLGLALILASLAWLLLWQPLEQARQAALARVATQRDTLTWMRGAATQVQVLRSAGTATATAAPAASLLGAVEQTAKGSAVAAALRQLDPEGDDGLRVSLEAVSFDNLITWLGRLQAQGVSVANLTLNRLEGGQLVQARLLLRRGGTR